MNALLGFAPFLAFALLERFVGVVPALCAAALVSGAIIVRDLATRGRSVKLLEVGSLLLFGGLAVWTLATGESPSVLVVRLRVDLGLLAIVLLSMAVRRPFTLAYAKERVSPDVWQRPQFLRMNQVITGAWAVAFAVLIGADLLMLYVPGVPLAVGVVVTLAALVGASRFTQVYSERVRAKARAAAGTAVAG